jgi:hypothetical protein
MFTHTTTQPHNHTITHSQTHKPNNTHTKINERSGILYIRYKSMMTTPAIDSRVAIQDESISMGSSVGRALYSTCAISAGTCILTEEPIVAIHPSIIMSQSMQHAKDNGTKTSQFTLSSLVNGFELQLVLAWLRSGRREKDFDKHGMTRSNIIIPEHAWQENKRISIDIAAIQQAITSKKPTLQSIVRIANRLTTYTIPLFETMTGETSGFAIGNTLLSAINYSCIPNVIINYKISNGNRVVLELHALRDIEACEELTVCYQPNSEFSAYFTRREVLQQKFGFDCECVTCKLQENEMKQDRSQQSLIHFNVNEQMKKTFNVMRYTQQQELHADYNNAIRTRDAIEEKKEKGVDDVETLMSIEKRLHSMQWLNLVDFIFVNDKQRDFANGIVPDGYHTWPWNICEQLRVCIIRLLGAELSLKQYDIDDSSSSSSASSIQNDAVLNRENQENYKFLENVFLMLNQYIDLVSQCILAHHTPVLSYYVAFTAVLIKQRFVIASLRTDDEYKEFSQQAPSRAYVLLETYLSRMKSPHGLALLMLRGNDSIIHPSWLSGPLREACIKYDAHIINIE